MTMENKKCPFCAEIILKAAVKCRYCGSDVTEQASVPEPLVERHTAINSYQTTWSILFESGPGYWKVKPFYWVAWLAALTLCFVSWPVGVGLFGFLLVASLVSRGDWRKNELQKAILDSSDKN